jgi:SET domain-containing protein
MIPKKYAHIRRKLVARRGIAGLGLFTEAPIERGGYVIEYTGSVLSREIADKKGGKYLFEISADRVIDGTGRDNLARYINHSCRPNCEPSIRKGSILIFAKRAIKPGEELSYDYGDEYFDEHIKPFGCKCDYHRAQALKKS